MIGITEIGTYLPKKRIETADLVSNFGVDESFIETKTGFSQLSRKGSEETVVDMCEQAFNDLQERSSLNVEDIDFISVCTQNPDVVLPQVSAMLQDRLNIPASCASYDIALGCSGFVYSITLAEAFMERQQFKSGIVFTCDPYSPHLAEDDKNTQLLFGDGATATYLSDKPIFSIHDAAFATIGSKAKALIKEKESTIFMDGRDIFNFTMRDVPATLKRCVAANQCELEDIDLFVIHQASKYVVSNLSKRMKIPAESIPFMAGQYGNTVSSSIPLVLKEFLKDNHSTIALCGFGVGLSIAAVILRRIN